MRWLTPVLATVLLALSGLHEVGGTASGPTIDFGSKVVESGWPLPFLTRFSGVEIGRLYSINWGGLVIDTLLYLVVATLLVHVGVRRKA